MLPFFASLAMEDNVTVSNSHYSLTEVSLIYEDSWMSKIKFGAHKYLSFLSIDGVFWIYPFTG